MLLEPRRLDARAAHRRRPAGLPRERRGSRLGRDPCLCRGAGHARPRDGRGRRRRAGGLRRGLAGFARSLGLRAAVAGTHPTVVWSDVEVSPDPGIRRSTIRCGCSRTASRRSRCTCTSACRTRARGARAGRAARVPPAAARAGRELAVLAGPRHRARLRADPDLLDVPALGHRRVPSATTATGSPPSTPMVRGGAIPDPSFLWWDARLQPRFGTVEVRVMDAQTRVEDTAALVALVQSLVRLHAEEGTARARGRQRPRRSPRTASSRLATGSTREFVGRLPRAATARRRAPGGRAGGVPPGRGRPRMPRGAGVRRGAGQSPGHARQRARRPIAGSWASSRSSARSTPRAEQRARLS